MQYKTVLIFVCVLETSEHKSTLQVLFDKNTKMNLLSLNKGHGHTKQLWPASPNSKTKFHWNVIVFKKTEALISHPLALNEQYDITSIQGLFVCWLTSH